MDALDHVDDLVADALPVEPPAPRALSPLDEAIERGVATLRGEQSSDGYWCYEFEADCTIPAEYVLMMHFMDEVDPALEAKIGVYLRDK